MASKGYNTRSLIRIRLPGVRIRGLLRIIGRKGTTSGLLIIFKYRLFTIE